MKKKIEVFDYAGTIINALTKGVLITTNAEKVNSMTISWGAFGVEWGKPIFTTYIRESRYTREQIDKTNEFTVNIPLDDKMKKAIAFCGSKSGRDTDKIKELGFSLENGECINVPGIKELPLTLECKVVYKKMQDVDDIPEEYREMFYPIFKDGKPDKHIAYYGEIVNAYIAE